MWRCLILATAFAGAHGGACAGPSHMPAPHFSAAPHIPIATAAAVPRPAPIASAAPAPPIFRVVKAPLVAPGPAGAVPTGQTSAPPIDPTSFLATVAWAVQAVTPPEPPRALWTQKKMLVPVNDWREVCFDVSAGGCQIDMVIEGEVVLGRAQIVTADGVGLIVDLQGQSVAAGMYLLSESERYARLDDVCVTAEGLTADATIRLVVL